jgi:uncharacterized protein YkwD
MKVKIIFATAVIIALYAIYYRGYYMPPAFSNEPASYENLCQEIIKQLNKIRVENGLAPFTENPLLTKAAMLHSQDMAAHRLLSHRGSDGSMLEDRLARVGYNYYIAAENIIEVPTPALSGFVFIWFIPLPIPNPPKNATELAQEMVNAWMDSPGHRANILNPQLTEIGVGAAPSNASTIYATTDFGGRYW